MKKSKLLKLVWQEPQSPKQLNSLLFRKLPYQGPRPNTRSTEKTLVTGFFSGRTYRQRQTSIKTHCRWRHRTTALKVTAKLNQHLNSPVSTKTVRRELDKAEYHGRAATGKLLLFTMNFQVRLKWCRDHKGWFADRWKKVIFSDESSFSLFPTAWRVYVWRQPIGKHTTLTAIITQWSTEVDQWWFGQLYRGILSVLSLPCTVKINSNEIMFIQCCSHYSLMVTASFKTIMLRNIPFMWLRIGIKTMKVS